MDRLDHCSALLRITRTNTPSLTCSRQTGPHRRSVDVERSSHDVQNAQDLWHPAQRTLRSHSRPSAELQHVPCSHQQWRWLLHRGRMDGGAGNHHWKLQRWSAEVCEWQGGDAMGQKPHRESISKVGVSCVDAMELMSCLMRWNWWAVWCVHNELVMEEADYVAYSYLVQIA